MSKAKRKRMKSTLPRLGTRANIARLLLLAYPDNPDARRDRMVEYERSGVLGAEWSAS